MNTNNDISIIANIELYPTSKGGRGNSLSGEYFGCPAKIGEKFFDCRIYLAGQTIDPGTIKMNVPIKFLSPNLVMPILKVGTRFFLWESNIFGEAIVLQIY